MKSISTCIQALRLFGSAFIGPQLHDSKSRPPAQQQTPKPSLQTIKQTKLEIPHMAKGGRFVREFVSGTVEILKTLSTENVIFVTDTKRVKVIDACYIVGKKR